MSRFFKTKVSAGTERIDQTRLFRFEIFNIAGLEVEKKQPPVIFRNACKASNQQNHDNSPNYQHSRAYATFRGNGNMKISRENERLSAERTSCQLAPKHQQSIMRGYCHLFPSCMKKFCALPRPNDRSNVSHFLHSSPKRRKTTNGLNMILSTGCFLMIFLARSLSFIIDEVLTNVVEWFI